MSGLLERIETKLDQVLAALAQPAHTPQSMGLQPQQPPQTQQPDPLAFTPPAQPQQPTQVTNQMITELIQPHINTPAIKTALQGVLAELNIPGLPAAREDQYPTLYARFQQIIQLATAQQPANVAGNSGGAPNNAGGMSIL